MHFLKEEDSPGEAGRRLCVMQLCLFQNGAGPSLGVLWLVLIIFCRIWVYSSASFTRM